MHNKTTQGQTLCFSLFFILHISVFSQGYLKIDSIVLPKGVYTNSILYKSGKLYAGTDKGLFIADSSALQAHALVTDYNINKIEMSEQLWLGTYQNILIQFNAEDNYKEHKFSFDAKNHLVTSMFSKSYTQYAGTGLGSVFIRQEGNKYKEIASPVKSNIYSIFVNKKNHILIGTTNGLYISKDEENWKQKAKEIATVHQLKEIGGKLYCIGLDKNQKPLFAELTKKLKTNKQFVSLSETSSFPKFLEFSHSQDNTFWLALNQTVIRFRPSTESSGQINIEQSIFGYFHMKDIEHIAAINDTACWISANRGNTLYRLILMTKNPNPPKNNAIMIDNNPVEKGINLEIAILFKSESWELDNTSRNKWIITDIKKALETDNSLKLKIEGHTGYFEDKKKAQTVSYNRAQTIKQEILKNTAIDENRISIKGFGNTKPKNKKRPNAPENRRVEIRFE